MTDGKRILSDSSQEPEAGLPRFLYRLRTQGPRWIWRRLQSEWLLPTTKPGKFLHKCLRTGLTASLDPFRTVSYMLHRSNASTDTLYAFYDLKVEPITFDIAWFLVGADLQRRRLGLDRIHVVIVPGPADGVREENPLYEAVVDRDARRWRIQNILIETAGLLPSCTGLTLASSRREAAAVRSSVGKLRYPVGYEPALPHPHHPNDSLIAARAGVRPIAALRAGIQALRYIDTWMCTHAVDRRVVTITIRDYDYNRSRNCNLTAWIQFAQRLDSSVWLPVFVLDTERTLDMAPKAIQDFQVFREVAWNVGLRMALYEKAWLNLGVNNGPMGLCWLNERTHYITFKMVTPNVPQTTVAFNLSRGFEPHQSLPFVTPFQKWVWDDDTLDVIEREFQRMVARIEQEADINEVSQRASYQIALNNGSTTRNLNEKEPKMKDWIS